jgi:pimeloyl-ACP methyl ester carboxylesterase
MVIEPYRIAVPDREIDDLRRRLAHTRWSVEDVEPLQLRALIDYWHESFDWRAQEAMLNGYPHFRAHSHGDFIHFVHVRSSVRGATPILLTHGWPGSFYEFLKLIPLLEDFDVVIPSLPGFAFSSPVHTNLIPYATAEFWAKLMLALGYEKFVAQGGGCGANVATWIALQHPERLIGLHLNSIPLTYEPPVLESQPLTQEESRFFEERARWYVEEGSVAHLQATRLKSLAHALNDSPVGLAAWFLETFRSRSSPGIEIDSVLTHDELLTNLSIYWYTQTIGSSFSVYATSRQHALKLEPRKRVRTPTAVAHFPKELLMPPRSWVARGYELKRWTQMPRGGPFAALEQPELFASDLRAFLESL